MIQRLLLSLMFAFPALADNNDSAKALEKLKGLIVQILKQDPSIITEAQQAYMQKAEESQDSGSAAILKKLEKNPDLLSKTEPTITLGKGKKKMSVFLMPYCGHCQELLKHLVPLTEKHGDKCQVKLYVVANDKAGKIAGKGLRAASKMNKMPQILKAMLERVNRLEAGDFLNIAKQHEIDGEAFSKLMDENLDKEFETTNAATDQLGLSGFPTVIYEQSGDGKKHEVIEGNPGLEKLQMFFEEAK